MDRKTKLGRSGKTSIRDVPRNVPAKRASAAKRLGDQRLEAIAEVQSRIAAVEQAMSGRFVVARPRGRTPSSWSEEERVYPRKGYEVASNPEWKGDVFQYRHPQAVTFDSEADLDRAFRSFDDPKSPLFMVPHDLVEGLTIVLPQEALPYLRKATIKFKHSEVLSTSTLSPEERAKLRP